MRRQLDDGKYCALRVANSREASHILDIHRWHDRLCAKGDRLLKCRVAITHRKVDSPVRRRRPHLRLDLHHPASMRVAVNKLRIRHWLAMRLINPAKQLGIKVARSAG